MQTSSNISPYRETFYYSHCGIQSILYS